MPVDNQKNVSIPANVDKKSNVPENLFVSEEDNTVIFNDVDETEEGEIISEPKEFAVLNDFINITYPAGITRPSKTAQGFSYSLDFLKAFSNAVKFTLEALPSNTFIFCHDRHVSKSHDLQRQSSDLKRPGSGRVPNKIGERKMSRQNSSRGGKSYRSEREKEREKKPAPVLVRSENAWGGKKVELNVQEKTLRTIKGISDFCEIYNAEGII